MPPRLARRPNLPGALAGNGADKRTGSVIPGPPRQRKIKCGPIVHLALGPAPPAVPEGDPLHDGQTDAGAVVLHPVDPQRAVLMAAACVATASEDMWFGAAVSSALRDRSVSLRREAQTPASNPRQRLHSNSYDKP